jgi:cell division protein ZapA
MSEKRSINLVIADIPLSLNISAKDEEIIRKAAKEINERVLKYNTENKEPEPFYFLAYVSLLHTIKMLQQEQAFKEIETINLKLDQIIKSE